MKLCVIGNSHIGAMKLAYDAIGSAKLGAELTFFGARGNSITELRIRNGNLRPAFRNRELRGFLKMTSNGLSKIDPNKYDSFLCIGLSKNVGKLVSVLEYPYSKQAQNCSIVDYWKESDLTKLVRLISTATNKPIYVGHNPLLARADSSAKNVKGYEKFIELSNSLVFETLNAILLNQPHETIVNGRNTDVVYTKGSQRLAVGLKNDSFKHPENEIRHMNENYGAIWLKSFIKSQ